MPSPLPALWVEKLFERFLTRYGAAWMRMWEGIDMAAVKTDWAEELAGLQDRPEALKYALQYLPVDWPPTVQQFKAICNAAPQMAPPPSLPPPPASAEVVAAVREVLQQTTSKPLDWADRLRKREVSLERLTPYQRSAWRDAMRATVATDIGPGDFTQIQGDVLPPAMRVTA